VPEDDPEHGEVHERLGERPQIPEQRAGVLEPELRPREDMEDPRVVGEPVAEGRSRSDVPGLADVRARAQYAPRPSKTEGTVNARIRRSRLIDRFSMYSRSTESRSSKLS